MSLIYNITESPSKLYIFAAQQNEFIVKIIEMDENFTRIHRTDRQQVAPYKRSINNIIKKECNYGKHISDDHLEIKITGSETKPVML